MFFFEIDYFGTSKVVFKVLNFRSALNYFPPEYKHRYRQ